MKKNMRILLVGQFHDDLVLLLSALKDVEIAGYVTHGEDAISTYDELDIQLILMDIIMPGMTGLEAARVIREQNPNVRIVLLSEQLDYQFIMACVEMKLDGCVLKNVDQNVFAQTILDLQKTIC